MIRTKFKSLWFHCSVYTFQTTLAICTNRHRKKEMHEYYDKCKKCKFIKAKLGGIKDK